MLIGYYRVSVEDDIAGESNSIRNQRMLVRDYIAGSPELSSMPFCEFSDDGYSGASMKRPAMEQVLRLVRNHEVGCIVVKDFSRFARDYLEMGKYLEKVFPEKGIRFISVCDRYDSVNIQRRGMDIDVAFKALVADFYVKEQSAKVKKAVEAKRERGQYCSGSAPYGYERDPDDKTKLRIVEEEAKIVRRIFKLASENYSNKEISRVLNGQHVLTPLQSMGRRQKTGQERASSENLKWTGEMVHRILTDKNYIGCMVYGKTVIEEPGTGKEKRVPKSQWKIYQGHHAPIVTEKEFYQVQPAGLVSDNNLTSAGALCVRESLPEYGNA